jgi:hypothetical protein
MATRLGVAVSSVFGLFLFVAPAAVVHAGPVAAGYDLLETDTAATLDDLVLFPGFFGPGSDPFVGRVHLQGVPFDSFDPDGPGPILPFSDLWPTDTIVRRPATCPPPFPCTIPIEIVELSLVSASPITVTYNGGMNPEPWLVRLDIHVNPVTGLVDPPQLPGTMTIDNPYPGGGTFDAFLPIQANFTFTQVTGPGVIGPLPAPTVNLSVTGESWSHAANPLIFPADGQFVIEVPGLTSNFFPGCVCDGCPPPREPAVCYSVDGGFSNPARTGAPLTPLPNPAEGLTQPDPRHPVPNDVYALGWAPGGNAYETEGEIFQSAGDPLGAPPNGSNVDRMSSALGIGPAPGGPPFLGPFAPNPGAPFPAPPPPGGLGTFGLKSGDNVDGLSFGRDSGDVLLFSVDPATMGVPGTHVRIQAVTSPFGGAAAAPFPTNPGGGDPGNEAAGDVFKSLPLAPFGSYIPLHLATGMYLTPATLAANELAIDEFLLGLQAAALNGSALGPPEDDLDGLELSDAGDAIFGVDLVDNGTGIGPPDGVPDRFVFFSLDTASVSVAPGVFDTDDVLVVPPPGFAFGLYADGTIDIGLLPGDDVDALALSDVATPGGLDPGLDEALFSLHPGSPSVLVGPDGFPASGDEVSAADVFYTSFTGTYALYASAAALGLLAGDNVNAIDILPQDVSPPGGGGGGGAKKKLSQEEEARAKHGIRVSQKRRCDMSTDGSFQVTIFGFGSFPVNASGPTSGVRTSTTFNPQTLQTMIPTELVSMTLNGNSPFGPVTVKAGRAHGITPSPGANLPLSPASDLPAQSFFDVFVVIDIPGLGMQLETDGPFHVQTPTPVHDFPPYGADYQGVGPVLLIDQFGNPRGTLDFASHRPRCLVAADCDDNNACTTDQCLPSGACAHAPLPDGDGDGVCDPQDNCSSYANGGQGPVIFSEPILWPTKNQFCWSTPASIHGVVGPLSLVGSYAISNQYTDLSAVCHFAPEPPGPSGNGRYYVIEPDCPAGSYQTTIGAEPGRDSSLP